ncbi:MAG: hypothetical protein HC906_09985 [Bacteroidales bacterium]|nr:hypothetical protein [Bacteroidales bacterium]
MKKEDWRPPPSQRLWRLKEDGRLKTETEDGRRETGDRRRKKKRKKEKSEKRPETENSLSISPPRRRGISNSEYPLNSQGR